MTQRKDLYSQAGVDIVQGDALVDWLQASETSEKTSLGEVVSGIGGFAGLFRPNFKGMTDPILIASTDGVGTKLLLGIEHHKLQGLGQDLVAMCVNDLYTVGGRPLFFLDYFATGKISKDQFKEVLTGIKAACHYCHIPLLGGETAELPGLYGDRHFDLAGFVVGVIDGARRLGPERVKIGDVIYAIASSGFHSNGFSLLRAWLREHPELNIPKIVEPMLEPTKLYRELPELVDEVGIENVHAAANITGGGISGNLVRVLPANTVARIEKSKLPTPRWMQELFKAVGVQFEDIEHVFNLGAGMMVMVDANAMSAFEQACQHKGLDVSAVGHIHSGSGEPSVNYF